MLASRGRGAVRERSEFSGEVREDLPRTNGVEDGTVCHHGRYFALCDDCHPRRRSDDHHVQDPWASSRTLCGRGAYECRTHDRLDCQLIDGRLYGAMKGGVRPEIVCRDCVRILTA